MSETFFESPLYVYVALVFAELVLAAIWRERRSTKWLKAMLIPAALAVVVAGVAHFVVTDREQIIAAARDIAEAVEADQYDRIPEHLDDEFSARVAMLTATKDDVIAAGRQRVRQYNIVSIVFHGMKIEATGDRATMHVTTILRGGDEGRQRTSLIWDVTWIDRDDRWRVLEVTSLTQGFEL